VVKIDGRDQLISPAADWLYAYEARVSHPGRNKNRPDGSTGEQISAKPGTLVLGQPIKNRHPFAHHAFSFRHSWFRPLPGRMVRRHLAIREMVTYSQ